MSHTVYWPCGFQTEFSGSLSEIPPSTKIHQINSPLPISLLKQLCTCAHIDATFSENPDGSNTLTLVNNRSPAILQSIKVDVIESILKKNVFKKSQKEVKEAATKKKLERVITWKIYDFSGEGPGEQLCLFIYSRKDLTYLPLPSLERIETEQYHRIMEKFRNLLK